MRIERLKIDAFGHFADFGLELGAGLNLVAGQNEAGKTTLMGFIRSVLFGFERRNAPGRYEPEGGRFGGELLLQAPKGPLRVRRSGSRKVEGELALRGEHGAPLSPSLLPDALHGVSRELFCQVFAFGLDELSSFEELAHHSSVTEALFAAGMQGARRLPVVTAALRRSSEELFKPAGRKQRLNSLLARLEELRAELELLGDRPARYAALLERRAALEEEEAQRLDQQRQAARRERDGLARLSEVVPSLCALQELQRELAALPLGLEAFPPDGVARLEAALGGARKAALALERALREQARLLAERESAERARLPDGVLTGLRAARESFAARLGLARELPTRRAQLQVRRRQAQAALEDLGLGVEVHVLLELDAGGRARSLLGSLEAALEDAKLAARTKAEQAREVEARRSDTGAQLDRARELFVRLCPVPVEVLRRRHLALVKLPDRDAEVRRLQEQEAELRREQEASGGPAEPPPDPAVPAGWTLGALAFGVALTVAAAFYDGLPAAAAAALVALALVGAIFSLQRRSAQAHLRALRAFEARAAEREGHLRRRAESQARLGERLAQARRDLQAALEQAELRDLGEQPDLRAAAGQTELLLREAEQRARLAEELAVLEDRARQLSLEHGVALRERDQADARWLQSRAALDEFLAQRRLPQGLAPQSALGLLLGVAEVQRVWRDADAAEEALRADQASCDEAAHRLSQAAVDAGLPPAPPGLQGLEALVVAAQEALEKAAAVSQWATQLGEQLDKAEEDLRGAQEELAQEQGAARALLGAVGARDEEAFRALAQDAARRAALVAQVRTARAAIEAAVGATAEVAAGRVESAGGGPLLLEKLEAATAALEALEQRQRALEQERGAVRLELASLEADRRMAELRAEEECLVEQARSVAREYARQRLGLSLLGQARLRFEQEQQPRVVQLASAHFAQLTGFRYARVFVPAGEEAALRVEDGRGAQRSPEQLSRGTREQLYLAFRLAVVEDFGEQRGPLPLVLDDILVNFDPQRARNAVKSLARLAEKHQVIAFTCHGWLRELFAAHGARLVDLAPPTAQPEARARPA